MAERKAVNKYYPPDWDPRKGSVNKRVGQHPLRDRAKKLSQGILVIRFELPYNIWCGGCGSHVGMGVRYNAEKTKVGNYYTTPIYKFRMKCHLCDNYFEIQTDPKNHDYVILDGARRKEQRWDPVANEQIVPEDKNTQKKMARDAMFKLEHGADDQIKGKDKVKNLAELESSRFSMKEDYLLNRMARDKFRVEKKLLKEAAEADKSILDRGALDIELLEETEEDRNLAGLLKYSVTSSYEEKQKQKRKLIESRPLFEPVKTASLLDTPSSSSSSTKSQDSHNEETRQKLCETLRTSHKDPFAITKSVKPFDTSSNKPSILGIRLKGSRVTKKYTKKFNLTKKSVISHCQGHLSKEDPTSSLPSRVGESSDKSADSSTFTNSSSSLLTEKLHQNISQSTPISLNSAISTSDSPQTSTDAVTAVSELERTALCQSSLMSSMDQNNSSVHPTQGESKGSNSVTASGLSMLMTSYDEDKDSDDYSSS